MYTLTTTTLTQVDAVTIPQSYSFRFSALFSDVLIVLLCFFR